MLLCAAFMCSVTPLTRRLPVRSNATGWPRIWLYWCLSNRYIPGLLGSDALVCEEALTGCAVTAGVAADCAAGASDTGVTADEGTLGCGDCCRTEFSVFWVEIGAATFVGSIIACVTRSLRSSALS